MIKYMKEIVKLHTFSFIIRIASILATFIIIVDFYNIPSKYLERQNIGLEIIVSTFLLIIFTSLTFELNVWNLFRIKSVNGIDAIMCIVLCSSFLYVTAAVVLQLDSFYKFCSLAIINSFSIAIMITRGLRYLQATKKSALFKSNIYDLKDIYTGNFELQENSTVLMSEKDVDYDLLERSDVIDTLYSTILLSKPDGRFVISLEGKWGSGKTTIINNVKHRLVDQNKDILIIDEFDPWGFNDQESLFNNMFDSILKKSGYGYSEQSIKKTIKKFSEAIFGGNKNWMLFKGFVENNEISTLKSDINSYLRLCDKKVVFFIDNIDRLESKNVIMLFNSVANLLDFERITYVLSFDNERVKAIFDNELAMDYQYLKKIIQVQIRVPEIDSSVLNNVYLKCLNNLVRELGENENDMSSYELIVDNLCNQSLDVRDFKRFVNSVISQSYITNTYLHRKDLILAEYIRMHNISLYNEFLRNKRFFITYDKEYDNVLFADSFDSEKFSKEAKEYFEALFTTDDHKKYIEILSDLFPNVKRFKERSTISHRAYDRGQYNDVSRHHRICSAKYFDLYFTKTTNTFVELGKMTSMLINSLNNATTFEEMLSTFDDTMVLLHRSYHKEFFERLQVYTNLLEINVAFELSRVLLKRIYSIDDSAVFMALNARRRTVVIIVELMKQVNDIQFDALINEIMDEYINIELISELTYWMNSEKDTSLANSRAEIINDKYKIMARDIISNKIDIYQDRCYTPKNIWALYRAYKDENPGSIKNYIEQVMNKKNIFKIIYDIIGLSHGTNYTYSISKENLDLVTSIEVIDEILAITEPVTDDQKFVLEVYNCFKNKENESMGRYGITVPEERKIENL